MATDVFQRFTIGLADQDNPGRGFLERRRQAQILKHMGPLGPIGAEPVMTFLLLEGGPRGSNTSAYNQCSSAPRPLGFFQMNNDGQSASLRLIFPDKGELTSPAPTRSPSSFCRLQRQRHPAFAATLVQELLNFRVTIDPRTAHDSYAAWREGMHDDLVLAVAMACWWGERRSLKRAGTWMVS